MKVEFIDEDDLKVRFILTEANPAFANSWRRAMKSLVPTMAVDYVDIYMNTSLLYDEIIAHRIGLVPLKTDLERFNMQDKCVCGGEGCPSCQVSLRLNVEGPKMVYSGDFVSDDPETTPVYNNIPVVQLYEGQQLMIEAIARLGTGREHSKFQPVSVCAYRIVPEIVVEDCDGCEKCIEVCPRNVFEMENGKAIPAKVIECSLCYECVKECPLDAIKIDEETGKFLFMVEGIGQMPMRTVMRKALDILKEKAEEMNKIIEEVSL
jgi:DNA-directed RNA polymerase subunit D